MGLFLGVYFGLVWFSSEDLVVFLPAYKAKASLSVESVKLLDYAL